MTYPRDVKSGIASSPLKYHRRQIAPGHTKSYSDIVLDESRDGAVFRERRAGQPSE